MIKIKATKKEKRNAIIASFCIIAMIVTALFVNFSAKPNVTQELGNIENWGIGVYDFSIQDELKSIRQTTLYGGDIQETEYSDKASEGMEYLLVGVEVIKGESAEGLFNTNNIVVNIKGTTYHRMEKEHLLESHNFDTLIDGEIENGASGYIGFEIPKGSNVDKISLAYKDENIEIVKNLVVDVEKNETTTSQDVLDSQRRIEKNIYSEYEKGNYTIENPYVKANPYNTAPLTALLMFETENPSEISIRVEGVDEYSHVDNTFTGYKTHHEIPVYGLYAAYDNNVIIEAKDESGKVVTNNISIATDELPKTIPNIDIVAVDVEKYQPGMNFTYNNDNKMVFDINGDVRWYYTKESLQTYKFLENGNVIISIGNYYSGDVFLNEMNLLGKIYNMYYSPYGAHHDIEETTNNTLLVTSTREGDATVEDFIVEIDRDSGEIINTIDLQLVFDKKLDRELGAGDESDWFHNNSITWDPKDSTMILSGRFQSVVSKISADGNEIKWILSPNESLEGKYKDYLLTPIGDNFEWQYSQHAVEILEDLDNNKDTIDILLFDNGNNRSYDIEKVVKDWKNYSRMVHYRINEKEMTVEQIWQYGKERGSELYANWRGDADRLENGNTLGMFSLRNPGDYSRFVEVDKDSNVVFEAILSNGDTKGEYHNYRGERRELYSASDNDFTIGTIAEDYRRNSENFIEEENIITSQKNIEQNIIYEYYAEKYTINNPYIKVNPYGVAPLSALVMFESNAQTTVKVKVKGKDEASDIEHTFNDYNNSHKVPVYGLYPGVDNEVTITEINRKGEVVGENTIIITTSELPNLMYDIDYSTFDTGSMANGLTFMFPNINILPYSVAVDNNGDVRWACDASVMGSEEVTPLSNGRFITNSGNLDYLYYMNSLYEIDLLGKVYTEYAVHGKHHDVLELPSGNLLVVADEPNGTTVEDYMVELDRNTGEVVKTIDMKEVLPMNDYIADETYTKFNFFGNEANSRKDWFHQNAVYYDETDNSIVISGRHQDMVLKLDYETLEIKWILSDPNDDWTEPLKAKLLTPTGENFDYQYGQHSVQVLPNGDIFVFDNGTYRTKDAAIAETLKTEDKYSRAVIYRVNEENMTVEKIWEYGKELGASGYSSYISSVQYLAENHYLINFGGILKDSEGNYVDSIVNALGVEGAKGEARVVEIKDGEVLSEIHLTGDVIVNIYRARKLDIYANAIETEFWPGKELGKLEETHVEQVEFKDTKVVDLGIEVDSIVNDNLKLVVNGSSDSTLDSLKYYLVLSGKESYKYPISINNNAFKNTINKSGLDTGRYYISIYAVDENGDSIKQPLNKYIEVR